MYIKLKYIIVIIIFIITCNFSLWFLLSDNNKTVFNETKGNKATDQQGHAMKYQRKTDNLEVIDSWDKYENQHLPLIASIPEANIYLYAVKPQGVILYVNDEGKYFDWFNTTIRFGLPNIYLADFDDDGSDELAVIEHIATGTGVSWGDLHIVEISNDSLTSEYLDSPNFLDNLYDRDEYLGELENLIKVKSYLNNGELYVDIIYGNSLHTKSLKYMQDAEKDFKVHDKIYIGDIVYFNIKNNHIEMKIPLGLLCTSYATPFYIGDINVDVLYRDNKFSLSNIDFKEDE